jgi:hypothetical protein
MTIALVGSVGAVTTGSSGAAVTPTWGTGENRMAGNLLVCWVIGSGISTFPTTPAGWALATQIGATDTSATIFYAVPVANGVAAPTIAAATGVTWTAMLAEFSGTAATSPLDETGTSSGLGTNSTGTTTTSSAADIHAGELVIVATSLYYATGAATNSLFDSLNNGATANSVNNNGVSAQDHYTLGWGITTGNSSPDSDTVSWSSATAYYASVIASFKALSYSPPSHPSFVPVARASTWFSHVPWRVHKSGLSVPGFADKRLVVAGA